jgi:multisubunit Na+/H+ antiporter MnhC subunit
MTVVKIGVAMVAMLLVTACVSERDDSTVKGFFQKGRIGDESDAALRKL